MIISTEDYVNALQQIPINERQRKILNVFYHSPNHSATAKIIATALEINHSTVNLNFGKLGHRIADFLGVSDQPPFSKRKRTAWWLAMSHGVSVQDSFWWTLTPEFVAALEITGLVEFSRLPEEVSPMTTIFEGSLHHITVNAYERSYEAKRQCVAQYGTRCSVCEVNLRDIYGEVATGYIHVHHLTPLSEIGMEHEVDPVRDLRPVCPNCHAIIHRKNPPYTIEEVKNMLRKV